MAKPKAAGALAGVLVVTSLALGSLLGVEFVPRLEEGDLVIQTARLPSISPEMAQREAARIERVLLEFPEVQRVATRTGSPALATDPMGMEEADLLVLLAPRDTWTTAQSTEELSEALAAALERDAPGPEYTFTQPIEMRFNELLEGITSDVGVSVYGEDLDTLLALSAQVAVALEGVEGAADVVPPSVEGLPVNDVILEPERTARVGVDAQDARRMVAGLQRGVPVAQVQRGQFRDPIVMKVERPDGVAILDLPLSIAGGVAALGDVSRLERSERAAVVERERGSRRVVVQANVRGRDLGSYVKEAQLAVAAVKLPDGYWIEWSGKYEQLRAAGLRLSLSLSLTLVGVMTLLYYAFSSWRPAWLIALAIPSAGSGGVLALLLRDLPLSMSAVVGFIALSGIAVMNGIVLLSRTQALHSELDAPQAALQSAVERFRPVLMTAFVAGIGFLPMALATGVGAEVQRPLATVVIGGLLTATPVTLLVLPALYAMWAKGPAGEAAKDPG
jgi:cobalt-zinc-cadmium resistance protein CzcA